MQVELPLYEHLVSCKQHLTMGLEGQLLRHTSSLHTLPSTDAARWSRALGLQKAAPFTFLRLDELT